MTLHINALSYNVLYSQLYTTDSTKLQCIATEGNSNEHIRYFMLITYAKPLLHLHDFAGRNIIFIRQCVKAFSISIEIVLFP